MEKTRFFGIIAQNLYLLQAVIICKFCHCVSLGFPDFAKKMTTRQQVLSQLR